jgi:hypothetical protein
LSHENGELSAALVHLLVEGQRAQLQHPRVDLGGQRGVVEDVQAGWRGFELGKLWETM